MADSITPVAGATGPFDTAAMQIALANAQAAAANVNQLAYLQEIANTNDTTNASAFDSTATAPTDNLFTNSLLSVDPSVTPAITTPDPFTDPFTAPSSLAFPTEFGSDSATVASSNSVSAQQLQDIGILQQDAALLEEAANANNPIPLGTSASTVDLSLAAQGIVAGNTVASVNGAAPLPAAQLTQLGAILQPVANEPLTAALLQQIQAQLTAAQNPLQLNVSTIALAMSFIAALQSNPSHAVENTVTKVDSQAVAPVSAIDRAAIEDGAIR